MKHRDLKAVYEDMDDVVVQRQYLDRAVHECEAPGTDYVLVDRSALIGLLTVIDRRTGHDCAKLSREVRDSVFPNLVAEHQHRAGATQGDGYVARPGDIVYHRPSTRHLAVNSANYLCTKSGTRQMFSAVEYAGDQPPVLYYADDCTLVSLSPFYPDRA